MQTLEQERCENCIYWMEDMCINDIVADPYSDIEIEDDWCELWRSEDDVIRDEDA